MNIRAVAHFVALMLVVLGIVVGVCGVVAVYFDDPADAQKSLFASSIAMLVAGLLMAFATRGKIELKRRDGFGIVAFGWLFAALFGALPYILSGVIPDPVSAVFETMSGFTTTGASVLSDLENLPRGIMFWRAATHLLGGMGVLILCVAILPLLGVGGMHIYRAELPGPTKDRLSPRIATTAKLLWGVYIVLCILETTLLCLGGMSWFDALCHTFATMATGGFSTRTASIGAYNSIYFELVITIFMFLAGTNFALHYRALAGKPRVYFKDPEFRFYISFWLTGCLLLSFNTFGQVYNSFAESLRYSFFTGTSILTTTGFSNANFNLWPASSKILLVLFMFLGGCAGSTGGGIKVVRIMIVLKKVLREIVLFMRPKAVIALAVGKKNVDQTEISHISAFFMLFVLLCGIFTLIMSSFTPDMTTAFGSVLATISNIGPGLGAVGAVENYADIPRTGQAILTFCMLLGRLELYTIFVVLLPSFWRK